MRDFQQGDIVLFKQETAATASYRLGLVGEVYPSLSDGKVSRVLVKYKKPGEKGYRVSERHACKLVLVIPVDEQSIIEDANNSEQVPSAQNDSEQVPFAQNSSEQVPFAQDQMGGGGFFRPAGTRSARGQGRGADRPDGAYPPRSRSRSR